MFELERASCRPKTDALIGRLLLLFSRLLAITTLCACASPHGSASNAPPPATPPQRHIYVTSGGLDGDCYQDLGQIALSESYAQFVVANANAQAQHIRELALKDYGSRVEAVINVRDHQNEAGTVVDITGEAVQLRNHTSVACVARGMPEVLDSASAAAAGGIVGTIVGGLSQSGGSVYGAEAGGAIGASAAAGNEIAKRRQKQQAQEAFIGDRLEQQRKEIAELYQQLSKLIGQQCDNEELSEQECEQRITAVQQKLPQAAAAENSEPSSKAGNAAGAAQVSEFGILNLVQEQQEIIDQLQQRIVQIKQSAGDR